MQDFRRAPAGPLLRGDGTILDLDPEPLGVAANQHADGFVRVLPGRPDLRIIFERCVDIESAGCDDDFQHDYLRGGCASEGAIFIQTSI